VNNTGLIQVCICIGVNDHMYCQINKSDIIIVIAIYHFLVHVFVYQLLIAVGFVGHFTRSGE
jgi:hypothetical protein